MRKFLYFCLLVVYLYLPKPVFSSFNSQFITVVNPVRISNYTKDILENIKTQYFVVQLNKLSATWLLTYDTIENDSLVDFFSNIGMDQELGIFLEVTPKLAEDSQVKYNDTGSWHHATSVFLSGYTQKERERLITTVFEKFKEKFGYYPTSVGAWWIDAYSLGYMKEKYGITANLGLADQFATDGYKVWGQYWSTPYYPSKYHAGIPASDESVKLELVTLQWAPRDPLNGYFHSYYSTQDYLQKPVVQKTDYFEKLVRLYAGKHGNSFGQIVVGLESDLAPEVYLGEFKNQMEVIKKLRDSGDFEILTMKEFSAWYRESFPNLSPVQIIETNDLVGAPIKVFWFQSPKYRVGITHNYETKETKIFDFRTYHEDLQEPYYVSPNRKFELSINIPSIFDQISNPEDVWKLEIGSLESVKKDSVKFEIDFEKGRLKFYEDYLEIDARDLQTPLVITENPAIRYSTTSHGQRISINNKWVVGKEGYIFRDLTDVASHFISGRKVTLTIIGIAILFVSFALSIIRIKISKKKKLVILSLLVVPSLVIIRFWYQKNSMEYYVSQGEVDALVKLSVLPSGRVAVVDRECMGCTWHTPLKPAVFANKRSYVQKWSKHPIVYNSSIFGAETQSKAKEEFEKLDVEYIYLTKYEDYIEKIPFSPGDLGIEKIYDTANAEIWRVKE